MLPSCALKYAKQKATHNLRQPARLSGIHFRKKTSGHRLSVARVKLVLFPKYLALSLVTPHESDKSSLSQVTGDESYLSEHSLDSFNIVQALSVALLILTPNRMAK